MRAGGQEGGARGWSAEAVATELGGVLRALDRDGVARRRRAPAAHRAFSRLVFVADGGAGAEQLGEGDAGEEELEEEDGWAGLGAEEGGVDGGWLESDDIEEF